MFIPVPFTCAGRPAIMNENRAKKKRSWKKIGVTAVLAVAVLLLAARIAVQFMDRDLIRKKITARIAKAVPGTVEIGTADIMLFPVPGVKLGTVRLNIPGTFEGVVERVTVSLRLISLIKGSVRIARVSIADPVFTATLRQGGESAPFPDEELPARLQSIFLGSPDFSLTVSNGEAMVINTAGRRIRFRKLNLDMGFRNTDRAMTLNIGELNAAEPRFSVTGAFSVDKGARTFALDARGSDLDVSGMRDAATILAGDVRAVHNIFTVLRSGTATAIDFQSAAASLRELGRLKNIVIKGRLEAGDIFIPGWNLDFTKVKGSCDISGGVLNGSALEAAFGRSSIRDGQLKVGLKKTEDAPLYGAAAVKADVGDIVTVLKRSVKNRKMHDALSRFRSIGGEAEGKMVIGDTLLLPGVSAEISRMRIAARHERFPLQVDILEGAASFDRFGLTVKNLGGKLGRTSFSGISGKLENGRDPLIDIRSGQLRIDAAEAHTALLSYDTMKPVTGIVSSIKGAVSVSSLEFRGRAADSGNWQYRLTAAAEGVAARTPLLPLPVRIESGSFALSPGSLSLKDLQGSAGNSSFAGVNGKAATGNAKFIEVTSGTAILDTKELHAALRSYGMLKEPLARITAVQGVVALTSFSFTGVPGDRKSWRYTATGAADKLAVSALQLPGPAMVTSRFTVLPGKLKFSDTSVNMLDGAAKIAGTMAGSLSGIESAHISLDGTAGPRILEWSGERSGLSVTFEPGAAVQFTGTRLSWERGKPVALRAGISTRPGQAFTIDMEKDATTTRINTLTIEDDLSSARIALLLRGESVSLDFSGRLDSTSIERIVRIPRLPSGSVSGTLRVDTSAGTARKFSATGEIRGEKISFELRPGVPLFIDALSLKAEGGSALIRSADLRFLGSAFRVTGSVESGQEALVADLDMAADRILWQDIAAALSARDKEAGKKPAGGALTGTIRLKTDSFVAGRFVFAPLEADITLAPGSQTVSVKKANLCGISVPGAVSRAETGQLAVSMMPAAAHADLQPVLQCLTDRRADMSGFFDLEASLSLEGQGQTGIQALNGMVDFQSADGRVYRSTVLSKILSLLNVAEFVMRPKILIPLTMTDLLIEGLPDLQKGFSYRSFSFSGDIRNGMFYVHDAVLDAPSMKIYGQGLLNLVEQKADMKLLVAPVRTLDRILHLVPGLEDATLFSVPFTVTGDVKNPSVTYLPLKEVSDDLVAVMNAMFRAPVKLLESIMPGNRLD